MSTWFFWEWPGRQLWIELSNCRVYSALGFRRMCDVCFSTLQNERRRVLRKRVMAWAESIGARAYGILWGSYFFWPQICNINVALQYSNIDWQYAQEKNLQIQFKFARKTSKFWLHFHRFRFSFFLYGWYNTPVSNRENNNCPMVDCLSTDCKKVATD